MFGLDDATIGTIASGIIGAGANIFGAKTSANAAEQSTKKQIEWERERATNAHQWEVQDLEKAGLNPILSAGGSGAATGGISPSMPDTSGYGNAGLAIQNAVNSMFDNRLKNSQTAKEAEQTHLIAEQTKESKVKQLMLQYEMGLISKDTLLRGIQIEQEKLNLKWAPYEKAAGIASDVVGSITPFVFLKGLAKNTAKAATNTAQKVSKEAKEVSEIATKKGNRWIKKGNDFINVDTGEIRPATLKDPQIDFLKKMKRKKG